MYKTVHHAILLHGSYGLIKHVSGVLKLANASQFVTYWVAVRGRVRLKREQTLEGARESRHTTMHCTGSILDPFLPVPRPKPLPHGNTGPSRSLPPSCDRQRPGYGTILTSGHIGGKPAQQGAPPPPEDSCIHSYRHRYSYLQSATALCYRSTFGHVAMV